MLTVFEIVLAREIDQADITLGIPVSIREHSDLKHLIGIFLNVLLIRTWIDGEDTFLNHLLRNKETLIETFNHQDYPYERLDYKLRENDHLKQSELFSVLFNYFTIEKNREISAFGDDFEVHSFEIQEFAPKYDITLYVDDLGGSMSLLLVYKSNLYDVDTIKVLLDNIFHFIHLVLENETMIISGLIPSGEEEEDDDFAAQFEKDYDGD
jgi:non-ribosomal peptide synthetase component F